MTKIGIPKGVPFLLAPACVGVARASTMHPKLIVLTGVGWLKNHSHYFRGVGMGKSNPRYQNGNHRRKMRARFKARGDECGICHGRLGSIHYDEPSDYKHPLSFVIDEIKPISRYKEFGYASKRDAAEDINNLQAAHYICNAKKGAKTLGDLGFNRTLANVADGEW